MDVGSSVTTGAVVVFASGTTVAITAGELGAGASAGTGIDAEGTGVAEVEVGAGSVGPFPVVGRGSLLVFVSSN